MSTLDDNLRERHDTLTDSWQQVEDFLSSLHELARAPSEPHEFYRRLLEGSVKTLAASGGVVWQTELRGKWQPLVEVKFDANLITTHHRMLQQAGVPRVLTPGSDNPTESAILIGAVSTRDAARPQTIVELFLRTGAGPDVQQGWQEFLAAVIHAAEEFELRAELRRLHDDQRDHTEVLALLRRIHSGATLTEVAHDLANEGSRFLGVDRLSVLLRLGNEWRLLAASGVERLEARADAVKDLESLAEVTAHWGEPLDYTEGTDAAELPPSVAAMLSEHIDHSHSRRLIAVPLEFTDPTESKKSRRAAAVLIAENFGVASQTLSRQRVMELAQLCEPALRQVAEWDRWPIRKAFEWTNRATRVWEEWGVSRLALVVGAIATLLAALIFVRTDFEIEANATLMPQVVQDVFATTSGTVREIKVEHGAHVKQGTVLAILDDPQLDLEAERVRGELATVRKRLEAIAVARTDRQTREEPTTDRLPLSAEAKQLELRQASLVKQEAILEKRHESLTLRSPLTGTLLTLDIQNLLQGRPVERGQVLFTVADTQSGWQLETNVPQDRIGHVLAAQQATAESLAVRFRLAGDSEHTYTGHVNEIAETAVLDPEKLTEELPEVRMIIAVDTESLHSARPEMEARVRINCGRRSLGHVWLHDAWDNIYSWLAF